MTTSYRTCPLCEATCGLEVTVEQGSVTRIRGDRDDVFSRGYLCPKGSTLKQLHEDPDRLRRPLVKRGGVFVEVTWEEAWAEIEDRLLPVLERDRDAVAIYVGNPSIHNLGGQLYVSGLIRALRSRNRFTAATVDQMPKLVSAGLMFGTGGSIPVPDVDRTDYLLVLGANPYASNGSLLTAPDLPGRLEALQARGGRLVVVDPRRTRTAEQADEHLAIRPGTDALFLFGVVSTLFDEDLVALGAVEEWVQGVEDVRALARELPAERVAPRCGLDAAAIRRVARELASSPSAAVYGRMGTTTQEFGTLASWLVDVVNTLTGNLDRPGGAMFPKPATGSPSTTGRPGVGRGITLGSRRSRARGRAGALGELPVAAMAEEITTPGEGQVRALIAVAGNPVLSTPNGARLDAALGELEFMVSIDVYLNETSRHADVILPVPSPLARPHYDVVLYGLAIRNVANYSPPTLALEPGEVEEWEVLLRLTALVSGHGTDPDIDELDRTMAAGLLARAVADHGGPVHGRDPDELLADLAPRRGPERLLDLLLRTGPYGDGFGARPGGLSLAVLEENPHGVDLGPLEPRIPGMLRTRSGRVELAPPELLSDVGRLVATLERPNDGEHLVLVGRRHVRSNNSWMHNLEVLVRGEPRCTLQVHPDDAARLGLVAGGLAMVASRVNALEIPVEITDAIRPGVVSIPHGWGHDAPGSSMGVAARHAGVNANLLTDEDALDPLSGTSVLNGTPVTVAPV